MSQSEKPVVATKPPAKKSLALTLSCIIWVVGIILTFVIPAHSALIWLPDALLLIGFGPCLYQWKQHWFTLFFGLANTFIGMFLLVLQYLPDDKFTGQAGRMRDHLISMHSAYTWMIIGVLSATWGLIGCLVWLVLFVKRKCWQKTR